MLGRKPYRSKAFVPLPPDDQTRKSLGESYDPAKTLNVVKMFAGTDDMSAAAIGLVKSVFAAEGVDPKVRQVVVLRAAKVLSAPYEWQANIQLSLNNGLSQAVIDALGADGTVQGIEEEYLLICKATDEISNGSTIEDNMLQRMTDKYGDTITRKLTLIIAWFNLLSRFLNGCRVPMETTDKVGSNKSPLG